MKTPVSKLITLAGAVALALAFTSMAARAEETASPGKKADREAKKESAALKKFDANGNGVLDPDEQAARKASEDKARSDRAEKRKARAAERAQRDKE